MTRLATLVALLALTVLLVTGCGGVSQDSYDAAVKEANDLRNQLSEVQADLATAQADLNKSNSDLAATQQNLDNILADRDSILHQKEEIEADLSTAEANLTIAQTNLSKSNADLAASQQSFSILNTSVKTYQPYVEACALWLDAWEHYTEWNQNAWDTWEEKMVTAISTNQELQAAWDKIGTTTGAEHNAAEEAFSALLSQRLDELKPNTQ